MLSKARAEYYRDINTHLRPRRRKLLHEKDPHSNKSLIPTISNSCPTQCRQTGSRNHSQPFITESSPERKCTSPGYSLRTLVCSAGSTSRSRPTNSSSLRARRTRRIEATGESSSAAPRLTSTVCAPLRTNLPAEMHHDSAGHFPVNADSSAGHLLCTL